MAAITSPSLTATLCDHERRAWTALCTSGSALLPLLSANPVMVFPGGIVLTATSSPTLLDSLDEKNFNPWESFQLSHDESVPVGDNSGIVWYKVEAKRQVSRCSKIKQSGMLGSECANRAQGTTFRAVCPSVWTREGGGEAWKMVSHQQTLIE